MIRSFSLAALVLISACAPAQLGSMSASSTEASTTILIVRHAEKRTDQGEDPELSPEGYERAEALSAALADADIDVIVGSQYRRTTDTVARVAEQHGLTIVTRDLDTSDSPKAAADLAPLLVSEFSGQTILVAGHSNTINTMVSALTPVRMDELESNDYDNLFIVTVGPDGRGTLIRSQFGAPDPAP